MAKGTRETVTEKQSRIAANFARDIRQESTRDWTKISERIGTAPRPTKVAEPRISYYNPNNPLNGIRKNSALSK
jgi:hypothetical protein